MMDVEEWDDFFQPNFYNIFVISLMITGCNKKQVVIY